MSAKPTQQCQIDLDTLISQLPVSKNPPEQVTPIDWKWSGELSHAHDQLHYGIWQRKSSGEFWINMSGGVAGVNGWYGPGDLKLLPTALVQLCDEAPNEPRPATLHRFVSWTALAIAIGCMSLLAWFIPRDRSVFSGVLSDFGMEPPAATRIVLSIPDVLFPVVATLVSLVLLVTQLRCRSRTGASLVHLLVIVLCCITFVAYRESMFQPIVALMKAVQHR